MQQHHFVIAKLFFFSIKEMRQAAHVSVTSLHRSTPTCQLGACQVIGSLNPPESLPLPDDWHQCLMDCSVRSHGPGSCFVPDPVSHYDHDFAGLFGFSPQTEFLLMTAL